MYIIQEMYSPKLMQEISDAKFIVHLLKISLQYIALFKKRTRSVRWSFKGNHFLKN